MKYDIEKLERKTPYELPENVFEEVQKNVLEKTLPRKETKVFSLQKIWWAAAAIILFIGLGSVLRTGSNPETQVAQSKVSTPTPTIDNTKNTDVEDIVLQEVKEVEEKLVATPEKPAVAIAKKEEQKPVNISKEKENLDEVLNSFSDEELKALTSTVDHDVYMDLY